MCGADGVGEQRRPRIYIVACLPSVGGDAELRCIAATVDKALAFRQHLGAPTDPHKVLYEESAPELTALRISEAKTDDGQARQRAIL